MVLHINYLELKAVFLALKEIQDLCIHNIVLVETDNTSGFINKQGRRHEVGPTLCSTMENLDLVHQKSSNFQSPTHSRPAECGSRQAIQARPDHPNRVVSPSGLLSNMQQVAPASYRPICHKVQQVALVCVAGTRFPGHSSGWTMSAMGGSECICLPTCSHLGQSGGEVVGLPMQKNHSDCDNNMYLGPVVVAQQVLDPSPQTSYSQKEKKGRGLSATTISSGV